MSKELKDIHKFVDFARKDLKLTSLPNISFVGHEEDKKNAFGHSIGNDITIRIADRHPIDIMRTIAHELIHYKQHSQGKKSEQMKEDEANALAGRVMRNFDTTHPEVFKDKPVKEDIASTVPANAMGASSSTHGTGGIDTFDPLLIGKTLKRKKLSDIIGPSAMRKDKRRDK